MSRTEMANTDILLDQFVRYLSVERGLAANTWQSYRGQIRTYLGHLAAEQIDLTAATRDQIVGYLGKRKAAGLKSTSLFSATAAIHQFHRFLHRQGMAAKDPTAAMPLPKFQQRLPNPLSEAEMRRLLDRRWGSKFDDCRNQAMLELLYTTGMRISELTSLTTGQINLTDSWVRIVGKGGKERIVPIGLRAIAAILRYLNAKAARFPAAREPLFLSVRGLPLGRGSFWLALRKMARAAGLPGQTFPHRIRHSSASHLLAGGADLRVLQELLGHSSIVTTQRYTHVAAELLKQTCQKAHPRF